MNNNNRYNHNFPQQKGAQETSWSWPQPAPVGSPLSSSGAEFDMRSQQRQHAPMQSMVPQNATFTQNAPDPGSFPNFSQQPKKSRPWFISSLLVVLVLLGGAVFAMWWFTSSTPDVTLYQVGSQNVNQDIGGGGIVFPRQQLDISYPTSELVKAVLVKAGDSVVARQSLIQLDASQLNIQIQQAANDMAAAQATLTTAQATGNISQIAQAQQSYTLAKDRYNALVAQAQSPTLNNGNLISPMSGVVTAVNVNPGAVITANVPLITIMDESIEIVHAKIPLSNLGQVHLGQQATVTPSALPGLTEVGTVSSIIPQADPQTDTFEVWVSVTNTNHLLLPGMSAFVHIQSAGKALVVPRLAVLNPDSKAVVFVVQDQRAHLQPVQVVGRTADAIFIGQGIKAGDKVVLVGINGLQDNQPVRVSGVEQNTVSS
jgi:RND family efflux transporter MFP subunit